MRVKFITETYIQIRYKQFKNGDVVQVVGKDFVIVGKIKKIDKQYNQLFIKDFAICFSQIKSILLVESFDVGILK